MKKVRWEWETIDQNTKRVKVVGGWLVIYQEISVKGHSTMTSQFIADSSFEWHIIHPVPEVIPVKEEMPNLLKMVSKNKDG